MKNKSYYAKPDYSSPEMVLNQFRLISESPFISGLLHTVCGLLAVLNDNRQIVALNDTFMDVLGIDEPSSVLGLRPGEALGCIHKDDGPAGCGTTKFCSTCGAAISIVAALGEEKPVERLCALTQEKDGRTVETAFLVAARPVSLKDVRFVLIFLQDVTEIQRRAALERTFFHDVSNLLNMLVSAGELLEDRCPSELVSTINATVLRLVREVEIQRIFAGSSSSDYSVRKDNVNIRDLFSSLRLFFRTHPAAWKKKITFSQVTEPSSVVTDQSLLSRVLENMIINALEATQEGNTVEVIHEISLHEIRLMVHNNAYIPERIARRIFRRNFSTKNGAGRGYGTYAMKLLGEELLGGHISFTTSQGEGTVFTFSLPSSGS